jgi:Domain of unknown function (DUF4160)
LTSDANFASIRAVWFFFYSNELREPPHVHVERDRAQAKFWLGPARLVWSRGFPKHEVKKIEDIVVEHELEWGRIWDEYFHA